MKTNLYLIMLLSCLVVACNYADNTVLPSSDDTTFEDYVGMDDTPIDDELLLNAIVSGGFESMAYQYRMEDSTQVDSFIRFIFDEDGTCRALTNSDVEAHGVWPIGTPLYSHDYRWEYDKDGDVLTTTDDFGNSCSAKILFFDGKVLCYEGCICSEMMAAKGDVCRVATFKGDVDKWMEGAQPYDTVVLNYVHPDDQRFKHMMELCESNNEIDDKAFVEALLTRSFSFLYDRDNPDSGVGYGDPGIYYWDADGVVYYKGVEAQNYFWAHALVMFEDGTLRECFSQWLFPEKGELCYNVYNWSYDEKSNTLVTPDYQSQAEVLYFSGDVAILKGSIMGVPNIFAQHFTEALFYVRFDRFDRDMLMNDYKLFEVE